MHAPPFHVSTYRDDELPHLIAGMNVESHVVVVKRWILLGLALGDGDLVKSRNVAG